MGPCLNEMQRQETLHFISLKNTISRLEQIEPLVTIVLRLVRLVRVESPLSRLEQVVSIRHAWYLTGLWFVIQWMLYTLVLLQTNKRIAIVNFL